MWSNPTYQQILAGGMVPGTTKRQRRAIRQTLSAPGCWVNGEYVVPCPRDTRQGQGVVVPGGDLRKLDCEGGTLECKDIGGGLYECVCKKCAGLPSPDLKNPFCVTYPPKIVPKSGSTGRASNPRVTDELTPGSAIRSRRTTSSGHMRATNPMIPGMQFGQPNFGPGAIQLKPGALQGVQFQPGVLQAAGGGAPIGGAQPAGAQPAGVQQPGVVPVWPYWPGYQQPYYQPYTQPEPQEPGPALDETCCYDSETKQLVCPSDDTLDGNKAKVIETKFREGYAMSLVRAKGLGGARWMWHCR